MKCLSIKPIFVSISKMAEILCSDADFTVPQCVIKSFAFYSDSDFEVAQCGFKSSTIWSD
jgi:hypothetical protein